MKFIQTDIEDLIIIEPTVFGDHRGFFIETYHQDRFKENGINETFVQDNHSRSKRGTLRGLHYQLAPYSQGKLVRCTFGSVYDVAVDLRKDSPSFGKSFGIELNEENKKILYVPPGFAHGFYVMSEIADFQYNCTNLYKPEMERGISWNDPKLSIDWPSGEKILSEKDHKNPPFASAEMNF
jgi:dTDP-4-dehydrorhamnose 3,5-epimerase